MFVIADPAAPQLPTSLGRTINMKFDKKKQTKEENKWYLRHFKLAKTMWCLNTSWHAMIVSKTSVCTDRLGLIEIKIGEKK